jgi:hypothetical protein
VAVRVDVRARRELISVEVPHKNRYLPIEPVPTGAAHPSVAKIGGGAPVRVNFPPWRPIDTTEPGSRAGISWRRNIMSALRQAVGRLVRRPSTSWALTSMGFTAWAAVPLAGSPSPRARSTAVLPHQRTAQGHGTGALPAASCGLRTGRDASTQVTIVPGGVAAPSLGVSGVRESSSPQIVTHDDYVRFSTALECLRFQLFETVARIDEELAAGSNDAATRLQDRAQGICQQRRSLIPEQRDEVSTIIDG